MGPLLIASCLLGLPVGPARAAPDAGLPGPATQEVSAEAHPADESPAQAPLPRFTVGWYCPAPDTDPWRQVIGFGLGVALIWFVSERRKARTARHV